MFILQVCVAFSRPCRYNTDVCPWLRGPYELDWRLQEFSQRVVKGEFADKYQATKYIDNKGQLQNVLRAFDEELLKPFRMEEWFQMHIDKTVEGWMKALKEEQEKGEQKNDQVQQGLDDGLLQDKVFQEVSRTRTETHEKSIMSSSLSLKRSRKNLRFFLSRG